MTELKSTGCLYGALIRAYLSTRGSIFSNASLTVQKLPTDLLIFSPSIFIIPLCSQYWTTGSCSRQHSDWKISASWWGNIRSEPPPWISNFSPRCLSDIAEHSICHPGLPFPHGLSQLGSPSLANFQSAKSLWSLFPEPVLSTLPPAPFLTMSNVCPVSTPYFSGAVSISK